MIDETEYEIIKDEKFRKMLFSLILFHCTIMERKKYGPIGLNV